MNIFFFSFENFYICIRVGSKYISVKSTNDSWFGINLDELKTASSRKVLRLQTTLSDGENISLTFQRPLPPQLWLFPLSSALLHTLGSDRSSLCCLAWKIEWTIDRGACDIFISSMDRFRHLALRFLICIEGTQERVVSSGLEVGIWWEDKQEKKEEGEEMEEVVGGGYDRES